MFHYKNMDPLAREKRDLDKKIINAALSEMEAGKVSEEELSNLAGFVIDYLHPAKNQIEIGNLLTRATSKWPFLEGIILAEQSELKNAVEDEVFDGVLTLAKHGKVEEAIKLAKSATSK